MKSFTLAELTSDGPKISFEEGTFAYGNIITEERLIRIISLILTHPEKTQEDINYCVELKKVLK